MFPQLRKDVVHTASLAVVRLVGHTLVHGTVSLWCEERERANKVRQLNTTV